MKREINRILLNEVTTEERNKYFTKLAEDPANEEAFKGIFLLFTLNRILFNRIPDATKTETFKKFWSSVKTRTNRLRKLIFYGQAAAIILLMIYTTYTVYSSANNTESFNLATEKGSVSSTTLEEGTKIWLNTSSSAQVTKKGKKEVVIALSGEGYFEVVHNPDRAFTVELGEFRITNIGTSFNIKAYPDKNELIISMLDGVAELETSDKNPIRSMTAGEQVHLDLQSGKVTLSHSDYQADIDWKDGKFIFENAAFSEILSEFEEWYDVQFNIENAVVNNQQFTGVLKRKTSIEHLMRILKMTSDFNYKIEVNNDGSSLVSIY
jgi:transmembrane sensor